MVQILAKEEGLKTYESAPELSELLDRKQSSSLILQRDVEKVNNFFPIIRGISLRMPTER